MYWYLFELLAFSAESKEYLAQLGDPKRGEASTKIKPFASRITFFVLTHSRSSKLDSNVLKRKNLD